jgi:hypothetical protein
MDYPASGFGGAWLMAEGIEIVLVFMYDKKT